MLQVLQSMTPYLNGVNKTTEELFKSNLSFIFVIRAPILWWIDVDYGSKYGFDLSHFVTNTLCTLPLSTNVTAMLCLSYQDIIEICEDYQCGSFKYEGKYYQWPNEREWNDFCEILMDIKGVKELIKEDTQ